jgi:hypothetical protein
MDNFVTQALRGDFHAEPIRAATPERTPDKFAQLCRLRHGLYGCRNGRRMMHRKMAPARLRHAG